MTWLDDLTLETIVIHTINGGPSYRCVKNAVYEDGILVSDLVNLDVEPMTVEAGTHFVPRDQVHRIQLLGGG
jgi:hypothetical protein